MQTSLVVVVLKRLADNDSSYFQKKEQKISMLASIVILPEMLRSAMKLLSVNGTTKATGLKSRRLNGSSTALSD